MNVDTGRARAGWYASVQGLGGSFDFNSRVDPGNSKVSQGKREGSFIDKTKGVLDKYVVLINGVDYIVFLEYGHSKEQAPVGMVRISMRKLRGVMPKMIDEVFISEWKKFRI